MVGITKMKVENQKVEKEAFFCIAYGFLLQVADDIQDMEEDRILCQHTLDLQFAGYTGIQFTGGRRLWREACRSCGTRFHYVDRSSGVLWKEYFTDQFYERI